MLVPSIIVGSIADGGWVGAGAVLIAQGLVSDTCLLSFDAAYDGIRQDSAGHPG